MRRSTKSLDQPLVVAGCQHYLHTLRSGGQQRFDISGKTRAALAPSLKKERQALRIEAQLTKGRRAPAAIDLEELTLHRPRREGELRQRKPGRAGQSNGFIGWSKGRRRGARGEPGRMDAVWVGQKHGERDRTRQTTDGLGWRI